MIVLDTNVVSELMRPAPAPRVLRWVDGPGAASVITAVTAAELLAGAERLDDGARKRELLDKIHAAIDQFRGYVLSFDIDCADHCAEIFTARRRAGRPVSAQDAQIAAICRLHGASLATRNGRDFEGTGVSLLDPWRLG
ncbi:MAG TPA: type II toxin-antitoxin system VapC family toxin [Conexibacter sp.]|nr:type II toxin-antitoxin system VapC family toxin [Conexibacter sp.]